MDTTQDVLKRFFLFAIFTSEFTSNLSKCLPMIWELLSLKKINWAGLKLQFDILINGFIDYVCLSCELSMELQPRGLHYNEQ